MIYDLHRQPVFVVEPWLVGESGVADIMELFKVGLRGEGGHVRGP